MVRMIRFDARSAPRSTDRHDRLSSKNTNSCVLADVKNTPASVASCNASLMNATSAAHMAASQQLFGSLIPFTTQQLMMQQMMAAAAAASNSMGGGGGGVAREDTHRHESSSPPLNAYHR